MYFEFLFAQVTLEWLLHTVSNMDHRNAFLRVPVESLDDARIGVPVSIHTATDTR